MTDQSSTALQTQVHAQFDRQVAHAYRLKLIRKLEALGLKVTVEPTTSVSEASSSFS
jgi:hypothetical protein